MAHVHPEFSSIQPQSAPVFGFASAQEPTPVYEPEAPTHVLLRQTSLEPGEFERPEAEAIEARYASAGYGQFKGDVAEAVVELLAPLQERYTTLRNDPAELTRLLGLGAAKAREVADPTLRQMYDRMGFVAPA